MADPQLQLPVRVTLIEPAIRFFSSHDKGGIHATDSCELSGKIFIFKYSVGLHICPLKKLNHPKIEPKEQKCSDLMYTLEVAIKPKFKDSVPKPRYEIKLRPQKPKRKNNQEKFMKERKN